MVMNLEYTQIFNLPISKSIVMFCDVHWVSTHNASLTLKWSIDENLKHALCVAAAQLSGVGVR